jgi:hypothetical protein
LKKLIINIFTNELVWLGQIDSVNSLIHRSSWHEIVNSELTVSKISQGVEYLQVGNILVINGQRDKALIIEDISASLDEEYNKYTCIPLKGMLNYRIVHPSDSNTGNPWVAQSQSKVMKWVASDNLIKQVRDEDRKFWNSARTKNMFQVFDIQPFGETIDFTVDWNTGLMGDTIVDISKMYGVTIQQPLGWNIYITDDFSAFEMNVYLAGQKHINQTILPPVVFSEAFGNLKDAGYGYSIKDWRNVAYMTWNNGTTDVSTPVGNTTRGATVSFNRKEIIINSSKKTSTEVINEGRSELNKRPHIESFEADIIINDRTMSTYNDDWILGDVVTVQSKEILKNSLISIDVQITQIEETYADGEYSISATFGEGRLSFVQLIKQAIEQKQK